jgi:uncharacterized membrane protein
MKQTSALRVLTLGAVAGMRSMSAPALVSGYLQQKQLAALADSPLSWLGTGTANTALRLAAAGELVADKLPGIPARIRPLPLLGRAASGAAAGAALSDADGEDWVVGAALGAAAAVISAFGLYHLRRALTYGLGLPDPVVALAEDGIALAAGKSQL